MVTTPAGFLAAAVALFACALAAPNHALAASPVTGARYVGGSESFYVELKVARNGLTLVPRRSTVEATGCAARTMHLGSRTRSVRISPSGRFRYERTKGRFLLRVAGMFKAHGRARVLIAYRRTAPKSRRPCRRRRVEKIALRRIVPFRDCRTHPAKTVLEGPRSRVFLTEPDELEYQYAIACLYSRDKPVRLGLDIDGDPDVGLYRLAGPYVAYSESSCEGLGACLSDVIVRDLRTGKPVFRGLDASVPFDNVSDLVLSSAGAVAWVARPTSMVGSPPANAQTTLWASDADRSRVLDSGDEIDPGSLELSGSTLTWLKGGVPFTATLD